MISINEAKALISKNTHPLKPEIKHLREASEHILSKDIYGILDIPSFRQSSMDGYAIMFNDRNSELNLVGEMAAGTDQGHQLKARETYRIFTGAPLPERADTVVIQEMTKREGNKISFSDNTFSFGANVREKGSEIRKGELAMRSGDLLTPAAMAFLAGIGIDQVEVYPMPSISVILTGNELQQPGQPLGFGQVYESNSYSLSAALMKEGIYDITIVQAEDSLSALTKILKTCLDQSDLILLTGGVSVGDYDFVLQACLDCGVQQIFHKVRQKPGKPLFFGKKEDKMIFGLPGNPSSVLSCYYNYVLPAAKKLSNKENSTREVSAQLTHAYKKAKGLTHFLKGSYREGKVTPLGAQESYRLSSFAQANCLIRLDEEKEDFKVGQTVKILLTSI